MKHRIVLFVYAIALIAGSASFPQTTGIPDMENSWIEMPAGGGATNRVIFNLPNGTGSPFTEARNLDGSVDATVTLFLRDSNNIPIINYPAEDIFLTSSLDY